MIVLNTTFYVHTSVETAFLEWLRDIYFPSARQHVELKQPSVARILTDIEEGITGYAVQLLSDSLEVAIAWHDGNGAAKRDDLIADFGDKVLCFTTYMEVIKF